MLSKGLVALAVVVAGCRLPAAEPGSSTLSKAEVAAIPNAFPVTIVPPRDARYQRIASEVARWNTVVGMGKIISTFIELRQVNVPIFVEECGKENAFYRKSAGQIHICYELIALGNRLAGRPADAYDEDTHFMVAFTTLHEIGHAMLDLLKIQPADEEDRADQLALLALTNIDDPELARRVIHAPAEFFVYLDEERGTHDPSDPHSANLQRAANSICLLWGRLHDPALGQRLGDRAARCDAYTTEALAYWNELLAPYTRVENRRTFD